MQLVGGGFEAERWRTLLDSARDAYVAIDAEGVVTEWNRRADELFGWHREEAVGRLLAELIVPAEFREAHLLGVRRFVETGRGNVAFQRLQLPGLRRDGRRIEVEFTILPIREPGGSWTFHAFIHDVSAERLQRAYLRLLQQGAVAANEAETVDAALRATVEAAREVTEIRLAHAYLADDELLRPAGWWFPGPLEPFTTETAQTTFAIGEGLPGRVAASGRAAWIGDVESDDNFPRRRAALAAGLRAAFAFPVMAGERVVAVLEMFSKRPTDPDPQLVEVMDALGAQLGRVFERLSSIEQLQQLADDREAIVSIVGHELRGPLAAAHAAAGLIEEAVPAGDPQAAQEMLPVLRRQLERLRRVVETYVTAKRLDSNALHPNPESVPLLPVVNEVISEAALTDVTVTAVESIVVRVDPDHLWQIMWNLLVNADRHGAPPIEVTAHQEADRASIRVSDAGPGVPEALRERLFERFARDVASGGTGLGLSIVRGLARANGGDASYVSDTAGHAFSVDLPAEAAR